MPLLKTKGVPASKLLNCEGWANQVWLDIVTGKEAIELALLPAKLYVGRAVREVRANPALAREHAESLYSLYEKLQNSPAAQKDLARFV